MKVKKSIVWAIMIVMVAAVSYAEESKISKATEDVPGESPQNIEAANKAESPWLGKYCMSLFKRARTTKTVGKDHLSVALKFLYFDFFLLFRSCIFVF